MSEVLSSEHFTADAKGQTNALVSKKSESKFEAWMMERELGMCVTVMCVILLKVVKNPSKFVYFIVSLTGRNAENIMGSKVKME